MKRKNDPDVFCEVVSPIYFNNSKREVFWKAKSSAGVENRIQIFWGRLSTKKLHPVLTILNRGASPGFLTIGRPARIRLARKVGLTVDDVSPPIGEDSIKSDPLKNSKFLLESIFEPLKKPLADRKRIRTKGLNLRLVDIPKQRRRPTVDPLQKFKEVLNTADIQEAWLNFQSHDKYCPDGRIRENLREILNEEFKHTFAILDEIRNELGL